MKVGDLMKIPVFAGARIVAGENGMTRDVHSVNMMDAPDIIDFLKPDELLVTTGYSIKDDSGALVELVRKMAKKGCAGLGIKTRRFFAEVPPDVIRAANALAFPIIELPYDYSLGEIVNQTLNHILEKRAEELRYALDVHRTFTDLVFRGKGIRALVENLNALLGCPVLLLGSRFEIIAASPRPPGGEDRYRARLIPCLRSLAKGEGTMAAFSFPGEPEESRTFTVFPVRTHRQQSGFLVIFGFPFESGAYSLLAVEQAVNVMAFELMKRQAVEENMRRIKNEFFTDFLSGDTASRREMANLGKVYGLRENQPYVCVTCRIDKRGDGAESWSREKVRRMRDAVYDGLEAELSRDTDGSILFTRGELFVFLYPVAEYGEREEQEMVERLRSIQEEIFRQAGVSVSFGISSSVRRFSDLPKAYREADEALRVGYRSGKTCFIQPYRAKELTDLLRWIPKADLREFYESSLKELAYPADKEKMDLLQTLAVYLENHCQIAETAKQLYIHRNTVIYRLEKCKELLGKDLKEPDVTLRLRVALLARSLLWTRDAEEDEKDASSSDRYR